MDFNNTKGCFLSHRIHGAAIYANMDPINIPHHQIISLQKMASAISGDLRDLRPGPGPRNPMGSTTDGLVRQRQDGDELPSGKR